MHKAPKVQLGLCVLLAGCCAIDVLDELTPNVLLEGNDIIIAKNMLYFGIRE